MSGHVGTGLPVSVSFVFLLYFLLPGVAFVKAAERGEREVENLSRLDKLGYIMAGGTVSMFTLLLFDFLLAMAISAPLLTLNSVTTFPAVILVGGVILQSSIGALGGYGFGRWLHDRRNPKNARTFEDRQQPWKYISDKIRQQKVVVLTEDGKVIRGVVSRYGSGPDAGDLVLGSPKFIGRDGKKKDTDFRLGNEAFISSEDIAQIHYNDAEYPVDDDIEKSGNEKAEEIIDKDEEDAYGNSGNEE